MREVISLSSGQAGVQLGNSCWELYCLEHGLDCRGFLKQNPKSNPETCSNDDWKSEFELTGKSSWTGKSSLGSDSFYSCERERERQFGGDSLDSFFVEMSQGNYNPRNLMIDLEPTVVDSIRTSEYRSLYGPGTMISSNEDAANNFARGFYSIGRIVLPKAVEAIRKMAENCDRLQGFMSFHSIGGGTGSGFHAALLKELSNDFPKQSKLEIAIFPSPTLSTAVVEPYNAVLTTHHTMEFVDCVILSDNEAMYNICQRRLNIDSPMYSTLNRLLAQAVSSITASLRFKGTLNADFSDFQTNLVPYPRIHFPVISYAPIIKGEMVSHEPTTVFEITSKCFDYSNRLVRCENENGRYISCCLLYRGDITPKDVNCAIAQMRQKKDVRFVQWSPTGFKIGINGSTPAADADGNMQGVKKACCMVCNTTAIKEAWANLNMKYNVMLSKKTFFHWYITEGLEINEFYNAQDDLLLLEQDYECLAKEEDT